MTKLVTIIIPAFNHDKFISDTINSLLEVDYDNCELIIIDDASSDLTSQVIQSKYNDCNEHFVNFIFKKHNVNLGIAKTINEAIKISNGEYIMIVASDDYVNKNILIELVNAIEKDVSIGAVFSNQQYINDKGIIVDNINETTRLNIKNNDITYEKLLMGNFISNCALIKKEVFLKVGFLDIKLIEDWSFWLKVIKEYRIKKVNKVLVYYRLHDGNTHKLISNHKPHFLDHIQTLINEQQYCADNKLSSLWKKALMHAIDINYPSDLIQSIHEKDIHIRNIEADLVNFHQMKIDYEEALDHNEKYNASILAKNNHIRNLEAIINSYKNSLSYRLTKPLRFIGRIIFKIRNAASSNFSFFNYYKKYGLIQLIRKVFKFILYLIIEKNYSSEVDQSFSYEEWIKKNEFNYLDTVIDFYKKPKISVILPVYKPPIDFLDQAIESVLNQSYDNFELCIVDDNSNDKKITSLLKKYTKKDGRIKLKINQKNLHISEASNEGLKIATGEYVTFLDHDDLLPKNSLLEIVRTINNNPSIKIIYTDEDKIDEDNNRFQPYFKPDFNYDLLLSQNTFCHMTVYQMNLIKNLNGFTVGLEGSQDYDLALRAVEIVSNDEIAHIPKILYHWRAIDGSTALEHNEKDYCMQAGKKALENHFSRKNENVKVEVMSNSCYRNYHPLPNKLPLVSIVIPTKNMHDVLKVCIDSILRKTDYTNYEIIIVNNQTDDQESINYLNTLKQNQKITIIDYDKPYNFSAIHNFVINHINGQYICMLNNDTEVISTNWLSEMMSHCLRDGVGIVGAKLLYTNKTVQHAGVILGIGGVAGHIHKNIKKDDWGYMNRARVVQNLSAVTAACWILNKDIYMEAGGMDENLPIAFNDVDFCLKVLRLGYRNLFTPFALLYHHESLTRGYDDNPEKIKIQNIEANYMKSKWGDLLINDPAYNINFSLEKDDYSLKI